MGLPALRLGLVSWMGWLATLASWIVCVTEALTGMKPKLRELGVMERPVPTAWPVNVRVIGGQVGHAAAVKVAVSGADAVCSGAYVTLRVCDCPAASVALPSGASEKSEALGPWSAESVGVMEAVAVLVSVTGRLAWVWISTEPKLRACGDTCRSPTPPSLPPSPLTPTSPTGVDRQLQAPTANPNNTPATRRLVRAIRRL